MCLYCLILLQYSRIQELYLRRVLQESYSLKAYRLKLAADRLTGVGSPCVCVDVLSNKPRRYSAISTTTPHLAMITHR